MRTISPPLPDVTITHTQTGLSGGIPQNWGWPEQKSTGSRLIFQPTAIL